AMVAAAGDERIPALDPVHQAIEAQEVERAVDRDRRRARTAAGDLVHDLVGAERLVARRGGLPPTPPHGGQPLAPLAPDGPGMRHGVRAAAGVVMVRCRKDACHRGGFSLPGWPDQKASPGPDGILLGFVNLTHADYIAVQHIRVIRVPSLGRGLCQELCTCSRENPPSSPARPPASASASPRRSAAPAGTSPSTVSATRPRSRRSAPAWRSSASRPPTRPPT